MREVKVRCVEDYCPPGQKPSAGHSIAAVAFQEIKGKTGPDEPKSAKPLRTAGGMPNQLGF
jgi:hypothetical protein